MNNKIQVLKPQAKNNLIYLIFAMAIAYTLLSIILVLPKKALASPITSDKLVELVNQERLSNGLNKLETDPMLYFAARSKANDMLQNDYFEHYSPDGRTPWDFILASGYDYQKAGENLAMDFVTAEGIHDAWMASPTHKANIIKPEYEDIAIAAVKGEFAGRTTTMVVQMFGTEADSEPFSAQSILLNIRNFILGF